MPENPMEALWKSQAEFYQRFLDEWRETVQTAESAQVGPQHTLELMTAGVQAMTQLASTAAEPLRAFLAAQREMSEQLARWSRLQRDLADETEALSSQLGAMVEVIERWAGPMLDLTAERPAGREAEES